MYINKLLIRNSYVLNLLGTRTTRPSLVIVCARCNHSGCDGSINGTAVVVVAAGVTTAVVVVVAGVATAVVAVAVGVVTAVVVVAVGVATAVVAVAAGVETAVAAVVVVVVGDLAAST